MAHLAAVGEMRDPTGMASTRLAEAVDYPGSSVAFAQLLSGMERDGLIVREVRGKRTYRIGLPDGVVPDGRPAGRRDAVGRAREAAGSAHEAVTALGAAAAARDGFDYDELARRLLVQVVRRLAAASPDEVAAVDAAGALSAPDEHATERAALQETVVGLERELATAWTRHGTLTAENAKLREQLEEAQRNLERERNRRASVTGELNQAEVVLLERMLSSSRDGGEGRPGATAS